MPARRLPLRVRAGPVPPPFACPPHSSVLLLAPTASLASNAPSPSLLYAFLAASASRAKGISRPFSLRARGDCLADATPPISLPACAADLANVSHPLPFPRGAATDQVSQTRQSVVYHVAHADQASATRPPASHHGADAPQASATLCSALLRAANADQVRTRPRAFPIAPPPAPATTLMSDSPSSSLLFVFSLPSLPSGESS
ncbi:unnamed protein product [Closterium sp. NIES-65]|nr:unnamed protein product [Closterium sp. NIES-65]